MDISVYNQNFELVMVLDSYESLIWTDRFNIPGDFEIYSLINDDYLKYLVRDNYIRIEESEHVMIIENIETTTDYEQGNHIKITGRSLESILDRRIIWDTTNINGNLQSGIKKLITESIINPTNADRKIANFIFKESKDSRITALTMDHQYTGDNLMEIVQELTDSNDIGWKITLDAQNRFVFTLFQGDDRSYAQDTNTFVVFGPAYENVISSTYTETGSELKNVTLVAGEDRQFSASAADQSLIINEKEAVRVTRTIGSAKGLSRRELYTDARDLQKEETMTDEQYYTKLDERGTEKLKETTIKRQFDGSYETRRQFVYGKDFFLGDTVQVTDGFGHEAPSKIVEFIWSHNTSGYESYPTFRAYEYNE